MLMHRQRQQIENQSIVANILLRGILLAVGLLFVDCRSTFPAQPFVFEQKPPNPFDTGFMGVIMENNPAGNGVFLRSITKNSPAEKAGLLEGDFIKSLGDIEPIDMSDVRGYAASHRPGTKLRIVIIRSGANVELKIRLGSREDLIKE